MTVMPDKRAMRAQWQAVAKLLLDGADAERLTRLDVKFANGELCVPKTPSGLIW